MTPQAGAEGIPAPDGTHGPSGAGWIPCAICSEPIALDEYRSARCWTDPRAVTVAAHDGCLVRIGEYDHLPPDPGENTVTYDATP